MENEIISYQKTVMDVYGAGMSGNDVYLIAKIAGSKVLQILKARTNIEKLETFIKKENFDVAYRFAKNEKFSEEVLAEISRYYGDFFYKKVLARLP